MEVFSITCTTCKSRLKVRDAAVIGQILACPKCGGMVLVKPPANPSENTHPEPDPAVTAAVDVRALQETIGDSTFGDIDDLLSDAPPKPKTAVASIIPATTPVISVAQSRTNTAEQPASIEHSSVDAPPIENPSIHDVPIEPPPPMDWAAARPWRYWTLLAGSVVAGVVLAIAVVVISIQLFQDDAIDMVDAARVTSPRHQPTVVVPPSVKPIVTPVTSNSKPAKTVNAAEVAQSPSPSNTGLVPEPKSTPEPAAIPLELTTPPSAPATEHSDQVASNDSLRTFGPLLDGAAENPLASSEVPSDSIKHPSPGSTTAVETKPERPMLPRPPARTIKVAARLADPLRAIELDGVPLADFLQVMSDLSTIPITLKPDVLWFVKSSPVAPVKLKTGDTTIGAALADALRPLGLETTTVDDQLVVDLARSNPPRSIKFPIADLVTGDDQQAVLLAEWMTSLVSRESWGEGGGSIVTDKDALTITQQSSVHAELLMMCEKLRVARGLKPLTAAKFGGATFLLDSRTEKAAAKLNMPITLNYSQSTPLVKVIDRLAAAAEVRILIDWQSLATVGWTTETEATLLADKLPLDAALSALLEPMDLAWRVVDGGTLQVTTPIALSNRLELEFYRVDDLLSEDADGDALLERIRTSLGDGLLSADDGGGEIRFDRAGKCLLASLSQPQQQALAKLLSEWRSGKNPELPAPVSNVLP